MADEEAPAPIKPKLKLVARDIDTAPSLWPHTISLDDKYKDAIREGLAIVAKKAKETKKLYMDAAEATVQHRVKGAVMILASDLQDVLDRYKRGQREIGMEMGWYTAAMAQDDLEFKLRNDIANADLEHQTMVMVMYDNLVTTKIDDCPYGTAFIQ